MLSNIGIALLILTLVCSASIINFALTDLKIKNNLVDVKLYYLSLFQSTFSILSFFTLVTGFVISDFSLINVFQNSHTTKPIFYKIAGTWGNHEGSLLLWINILVIFSYLFLIYNKQRNKVFRVYTLIAQNCLILGFLIFLLINSNPFSPLLPIPAQGLGLNPILQDPALAIHPPLLYIGFVGSSIYFSAAIASLLSEEKDKNFAKSIKAWVLLSWSFQTLGILVGSVWAYYELGWGGFWFWDPVENASLMPWFVMTALMHTLLVLEKRNTLYSWTIILCLLTFTLSVTGTFLVRSGILNSVHTFANDPSRGLYILSFLTIMILCSLIIFFKKNKKEILNFNLGSKETFILTNNWFMAFYLATVLIGTTYPIFLEVLTEAKISVGPPYYNIVIIPFLIPFLFLMATGPNTNWIKNKKKYFSFSFWILLLAISLNFIIFYVLKSHNILTNLIFISSIYLIIYSLFDFSNNLKKNSSLDLPRTISHLGFGLLVFFIGINHSFSVEEDFNLKIGEKKKIENYQIFFKDVKLENDINFKSIAGEFIVLDLKNNTQEILLPEIRIYNKPETLTYEAAIKTKLTADTYLTMSNISRSEYYNIKFQRKSFMIWIWISVLLISLGGFLRLFKKK
jgi:cytochrome c-type biogenesis protein CcmF